MDWTPLILNLSILILMSNYNIEYLNDAEVILDIYSKHEKFRSFGLGST